MGRRHRPDHRQLGIGDPDAMMSATHQLALQPAFPELVRTSRLQAGLTQQQLADLSALSVRAVRDLEAGRVRRPRRDTVRLLADALRLGPEGTSALIGAAVREAAMPGPAARPETLLGRATELATLQELLIAGDQRLISVVGLPGAGKSRLAEETARRCELLGWAVGREPAQLPGNDHRVRLLVLDTPNLAGQPARTGSTAELVTGLQLAEPALRILHCSVAPLGVPDEHVLPLAGLPVPARAGRLAEEPAVALFLSHARRARPGLEPRPDELAQIAEVCRLIDGMPAAIGNAADWSLVLSWPQLVHAARADPLGIASPPSQPGTTAWQHAVRAAVAGLGPDRSALLAELAADRRGWTLELLCQHLDRPPVELAKCLHPLTLRGLVSCRRTTAGPTFQVPHLVSRALAGSSTTWNSLS